MMDKFKKALSDYKFVKDYAKWNDEEGRMESWKESVARVMDMHRTKYAGKLKESERLQELFDYAQHAYEDKFCLASQRSLQFGGEPTLRRNERMYNCLTSYCDRPRFFQEAIHWLLNGGGVGASVQKHHIEKLPTISERTKEPKVFVIEDSIEGWADAFGVLMSSYFDYDQTFPEYSGHIVHFDYSLIRPEGAMISGGFKAPGHEGLKASLEKTEALLNKACENGNRLRPIDAYDIVMHESDAVLSGGRFNA